MSPKIKLTSQVVWLIVCCLSLLGAPGVQRVFAYEVEDLPGDNLIVNPWFRDPGDQTQSSLYGWTDAAGLNQYWSSSQKESNPSPDAFQAGVCGRDIEYCGTSARLSPTKGETGGLGVPEADAYLYQVVRANGSDRKLKFFTHWVSHKLEIAEVTIYGGDTADGPWTSVWVPFHHTQDVVIRPPEGESTQALWEETGFLENVIERGYDFYKIEIHARLPAGNSVGFKISGVYFSTEDTNEPASSFSTPTEAVVSTELATPTEQRERTRTEEPIILPTETATIMPPATPTVIATQVAEVVPTEGIARTPEPTANGGFNPWTGFIAGLLAGGVLVLVVFGGVMFLRGRKA